jgi:hypothetical protein
MPQPPLVLDTPQAITPPDGLFAAAGKYGGMLELPPHGANNGAIWVPDTSVAAHVNPTPCQAPPYSAFTLDGFDNLAQAWPFIAYASLGTGAVGYNSDNWAEVKRRVVQRLMNYEQNVAERALMGTAADTAFTGITNFAGTTAPAAGIAGVNGGIFQQLAAAGASAGFHDLTAGGPFGLVEGISQLEQSLADNYYGQGFVHARPRLAAYMGLKSQFKFVPVPPIEQTWNEDILVLGNGYAGTGPAGQVPATTIEYIWASGRIIIWRGDVWVSPPDQLLNKVTNQMGLYAYRPYMIGVESFSAVISVDRAATAP